MLRHSVAITFIAAAALGLVAACGGSTGGSSAAPASSPTATIAPPTGVQHGSLTVNAESRTYRLYVPPTLDFKQSTALVVALTGCPGNGDQMSGMTNLDDRASTDGFIAVYPDPSGATASGCWEAVSDQASPDVTNDVAFIGQLIDKLSTQYQVDKARVLAVGFSAGGLFAYTMACDTSNRFAAIASVAGAMMTNASCHPTQPVSVLEIHGTSDAKAPYTGNDQFAPTVKTVQFWTTTDGCTTTPTQTTSGITTTSNWTGCSNGKVVRLITVTGGHHAWFGSGMDPVTGEPDATAEVRNFLSHYTAQSTN